MEMKPDLAVPRQFTKNFLIGVSFAIPTLAFIIMFDLMNIGGLVFQTSYATVYIITMSIKLALLFGVATVVWSFTRYFVDESSVGFAITQRRSESH